MAKKNPRKAAWEKRKRRISNGIQGTPERPRLSVFRTSKHMYAQVIDDLNRVTLTAASSLSQELKEWQPGEKDSAGKVGLAFEVGKLLAVKAKEKGIESVVFDRNGFLYHGRVAAVAAGARKGGLKF